MKKSCLKHTPPLTPSHSASGTPYESRNGSPRPEPLTPSIRKAVSFCSEDEGLEEVHEADDWDRSPTPMTPRLSYQDILELKQLRLTPPRTPTYRQPFTTSTYASSPGASSSRQPFPVSRFAQAQSLTPSKWKNREEPQSSVDPEILPYLDAVPIQLLPLLDSAPETPSTQTATPVEPSHITPLPSTSPPTPKTRPVSPPPVPAQPTSPAVSSPRVESPTTTPTSSPRRTTNFTFLPLLPVQEPTPIPQPPVQKPPEPKRRFNMAFVPLMPVNETQPSPSSVADIRSEVKEPSPTESVTKDGFQANGPPSESQHHDAQFEHQTLDCDASYAYFRTPSPTSTPSLSSASDTDTESEAPSTSNPSSPDEPEIMTMFASSSLNTDAAERVAQGTINPYFPVLPQSHFDSRHVTRAGQTPPLSILYPAGSESGSLLTPPAEDADAAMSSLIKKVKLQAIPSPSLAPPSPFSLYPPSKNASPVEERFGRSNLGPPGQSQTGVMTKRAFAAARTRSTLSLSSIPIPPSLTLEAETALGPSISRRKAAEDLS